MSQLRNLIQSLPEKDHKLIQYLALALAFSLLWFWNIAPALKTYQEAPLLNLEASRATLTLNNVSAEALAQFLAAARTQAQAMPIEAKLQKNKTGTVEVWRGTLILSLPSQS